MSRPQLRWTYSADGLTRAARWTSVLDVRVYQPPRWWRTTADIVDYHPITGKKLKRAAWFVVEKHV